MTKEDEMKKALLEAIATMVGTVIGAGILGIPYVVAEAGFWTGALNIVVLGIISIILYLYLGEVALRTKGRHQLTGYAEKYLGKKGKFLMMAAMVGGIYGALVAYIMGVGQAIHAMVGIGNPMIYSLVFFAVVSTIIYFGIREVAVSELYMLPMIIIIVAVIAVFSFNFLNVQNFNVFNIYNIFLPYGVVLFAYLGATAIPEMEMVLEGNEKSMKKAIVLGMLIPMVIYLFFAFFVVGVSGAGTTEVATIGLGEIIGKHMVWIGNIFAAITMTTSFLALGLALEQMYHFDYNLSKIVSWSLTCLIPLGIALAGIAGFVKALEISGVLAGGLTGILIVLMAVKAKGMSGRRPEYSVYINWVIAGLLIFLFGAGAGYYLWSII
ncbi:amino acid permease [Candidatus Woesearchaeota archaeon]|nr:amino acid permease [Candidatus Woesearchaeota archaeon]